MSGKFITNVDGDLKDTIKGILSKTNNLDILVGYFYFSGFREIYDDVESKKIRLLVGMDIEKGIKNSIREYYNLEISGLSKADIRNNLYKRIVDLCNGTNYIDTKESKPIFDIFMNKIENGTLEIRKTQEPNHAKVYLFNEKESLNELTSYVITGSSNLTYQGLKGRNELNVFSSDTRDYEEVKKWFNQLWDDSVEIVGDDTKENFISLIKENTWYYKKYTPYELYIRVLSEYFFEYDETNSVLPSGISKDKYFDLKYQVDAIRRGLSIIKRHNGVIVADVVGLGKSIIASVMARNLGMDVIVIAPPHLKDQWDKKYRIDFGLNALVYSSGKIERALENNDSSMPKVIIIDEAHKYRNEKTIDYNNLHKLCFSNKDNKVILLTATPFQNRPEDIFSMIKLFQIPKKSTIQTHSNLYATFNKLIREYKDIKKKNANKKDEIKNDIDVITKKIRNILYPIVIRRSRLDLEEIDEYREDLKLQNISFPVVNDPKLIEYDLRDLRDLYLNTIERICPEETDKGFIGARYKPTNYIKDEYVERLSNEFGEDINLFRTGQVNIAKLMKRLLVMRFESSIYAFKNTLDKMIRSSKAIKEWYEKIDKVPVFKRSQIPDIEDLLDGTGDDILEDLDIADRIEQSIKMKKLRGKGLRSINKKYFKDDFINILSSDIKLLESIKVEWANNTDKGDPKSEEIINHVRSCLKENSKRKIIIFSEYADTVEYLYEKMKEANLKVFKYTSKYSQGGSKETIYKNFDAGHPKKKQEDKYDILIATDAISEGYNLHRAGIVYNYDIPYNPTRVIQRVGRINRINKKVFDELFIYNFFPTATGENEIKRKEISTFKMSMIHALLGEDTKILTSDEQLESFYAKKYKEENDNENKDISWDVKYKNKLNEIKKNNPDMIKKIEKIPYRCRLKRSVEKDRQGVIVFGKKNEELVFKIGNGTGNIENIEPFDAIKIFEAEVEEERNEVSDNFYDIYGKVVNNLFSNQEQATFGKEHVKALNNLEIGRKNFQDKFEYIDTLSEVIKELCSLTEFDIKTINYNLNYIDKDNKIPIDIDVVEQKIPIEHLNNIKAKARAIEEGNEITIISEELI